MWLFNCQVLLDPYAVTSLFILIRRATISRSNELYFPHLRILETPLKAAPATVSIRHGVLGIIKGVCNPFILVVTATQPALVHVPVMVVHV